MPTNRDIDTSEIDISFVIPCLNEAESLATVLDEINDAYRDGPRAYEIIVADNGSTDGSQDIARAHAARVVEVPRRGYGAALIGGIAAARGTFVVMGDADGSYRFGDADPMIGRLQSGADIVMGNRFAGGIAPGAMPFLHRYLGNPVLSWLGRLFFSVPVRDFHCGLRAFDRRRIGELGLTTLGMEFASEMVVRAQKAGFRIEEVPVTLSPDLRSRAPHLRTWRDGWRHLRFLLLHSPRWAFFVPSAIVGVVALFIALLSLLGPLSLGSVELSYRTAIVASGLGLVATVAGWSSYVARVALDEEPSTSRMKTEPLAAVSALIAVIGVAVIISQLVAWGSAGFGPQPVGQSLLTTIAGAFFLAVGGISFFFALLMGLVRNLR